MNRKQMEDEIIKLKNHKSNLIKAKTTIQNELAALKTNQFTKNYASDRIKLCGQFNDVEQKIQSVNEKLRNIAIAKRDLPIDEKTLIGSLVKMRDKYQEFAADKSRVTSMRFMASEFVAELNPIIWKLLHG